MKYSFHMFKLIEKVTRWRLQFYNLKEHSCSNTAIHFISVQFFKYLNMHIAQHQLAEKQDVEYKF